MLICHCNVITEKEIEQTIVDLLDEDAWQLIVPAKVYHALAEARALLRLLPKCGRNDHSGHRSLPRPLGSERGGHRFTPGSRQRTARPIREQAP